MDEPLLLGIDVGTTSVKAALFTIEGALAAVQRAEYPIHYSQPGWVEQNPQDWWQAVCDTVQAVLAGFDVQRVIGVACSAQAPTLIALERNGQVLRPAMIWMDRRAETEVNQLSAEIGADTIFRATGNRSDAFYVASKFRWLKNHEPEILKQTYKFVQINGYINFRLTGTYTLDESHAALLQLRDYHSGEWVESLCAACGVIPEQFPPVFPAHHIAGQVTADAAAATGLRVGTPVMVGTVDGAAAALEAGVADEGTAAEMTGTSTVLLMPNKAGTLEPAFIAMPHALPGQHLLLGALVSSGASLNWYRDQFGLPEQQASALLKTDVFDLLTQEAAQSTPGSDGVLFLPYMMGERSPVWHSNARGVWFGLSLTTSRAAIIRSILEGTAFALRHNIDVARQAGVPVNEIRSVGGGSRSALWNQVKADITGLPVMIPQASVGAPFGDAIIVGMGLGLYPDVSTAIRAMVRIITRYEPNLRLQAFYQDLYGLYRRIYEHTRIDFDDLAAAVSKEKQHHDKP